MARIDDPLAQAEFQHRDDSDHALSVAMNLAAPLAGLLNPAAGAFASVAAFFDGFLDARRREARAQALRNGLLDAVGDLGARIVEIERKTASPEAQEAISVAMQQALRTARLDKARMFGRILGTTLLEDAPNWEQAAEFIRDIEQFSKSDVQALKMLWVEQRAAYNVMTERGREMSVNSNDYTNTWVRALDRAAKAGISKDEWCSRCTRLSGFGLTALLQPVPPSNEISYRLTTRGVRLLGLLGRNIDPGAYPRWRYHATKEAVIVNDEDEEKALGDGWADSPAAFQKSLESR